MRLLKFVHLVWQIICISSPLASTGDQISLYSAIMLCKFCIKLCVCVLFLGGLD